MRNELTRDLGSPAGPDVWNKPTWFISGGMITAHAENIASYYSSSYTGDHLDQVESARLPVLPALSDVRQVLAGSWSQYPPRDSLEWKGCIERWFVSSRRKSCVVASAPVTRCACWRRFSWTLSFMQSSQ